jgi:peptidyl-prolyl cis-trans isomerase D
MLQSIRDRTQGWIAGIIISLLILSFALWGIHSYFVYSASTSAVVEVNGIEITKGELAIAYERLRRQLQSQLNSNDELNNVNIDAGLKSRALQALINIQVLKQASVKQDFYISPLQLDAYLENMPEFQVNGQFSLTRFQQALATTMYTPVEFLDLIRTSLLIDQPRLGTIFSSFSLPNEVDETIALINQERDIDYVIIPYQVFSKMDVMIPDEMIKKYYTEHQDEFKTPEKVSLQYIELNVKDLISKVKPTDAELKAFYNENTNAFADPMKWELETLTLPLIPDASDGQISKAKYTIEKIYQKAKEGTDFTVLSKLYASAGSTVKAPKWVTQNQVPTDLQKTLLSLNKPNEIAPPVKVADGFVLLKARQFKEAQLASFDKVVDKVTELYKHQKAQELLSEIRENMANLTYQHPESLDVASKELELPIRDTELFTATKGSGDISSNHKVREAAFSNEVLTLQNNSDVIQNNPESVVVIRIKSHIPSSLLSLNAVRQQITDKLKIAEIDKKAIQELKEVVQKLNNSANASETLKSYNEAWHSLGFISRHATKVDSGLLDAAFEMPKPVDHNKTTYSVAKLPMGYAIIGLKAVRNGKLTGSDEYEVYAEQAQNTQGLLEYGLYKLSLIANAKIINK